MVLMESSYYNSNKNNHNWRKAKQENFHHYNHQQSAASSRPRSLSNNRKPSFAIFMGEEILQCSRSAMAKVVETKKYMHMNQDEKVLKWNDSAVEEAFRNAKQRFWAEMVGQPCDITPPDPDIFIDNIDWDSNVDPELLLDLDRRESDPHSDAQKGNGGVVIGIPVIPEQYLLTPSGWGDIEESGAQQGKDCQQPKLDNKGTDHFWGWDNDYLCAPRDTNNDESSWSQRHKKQQQQQQLGQGYKTKCGNNGHNWNMSRYKVSRFNGNGNHAPAALVDDYGSKRGNFAYERPNQVETYYKAVVDEYGGN